MIRVSVTTLEQFRRVIETDYASEDELVAQIKGAFTPRWQMEAGSAWDAVLTNPAKQRRSEQRADGQIDLWFEAGAYSFSPMDVTRGVYVCGPGIWQVKQAAVLPSGHGPVTVVGVADHINGLVITDVKAKFSAPHVSEYEPSLQWRFYLRLFGAQCFRYVLCDFRDPKGGYCELKDIVTAKFWPYPGLDADCDRLLGNFLQWADDKGLLGHLDRQGTSNAA